MVDAGLEPTYEENMRVLSLGGGMCGPNSPLFQLCQVHE